MSSRPSSRIRLVRAERLYALAYLGAHVGFIPLFALLLPRRVEAIGTSQAVIELSWLLLAGGITASIAHVLAGHWSDRWFARRGDRRGVIAIGCAALLIANLWLGWARDFRSLTLAIIGFQLALNVMLAPLGTLLADYIPDARKGTVAGMINATLPLSFATIGVIGFLVPQDSASGFLIAALIAIIAIMPLLLRWPFEPGRRDHQSQSIEIANARGRFSHRDFGLVWCARLLVQLGATLVLGYFYLYVDSLSREAGPPPGGTPTLFLARVTMLAAGLSLLAAIGVGRLSDRSGRRLPWLLACTLFTAMGLFLLAIAQSWWTVAFGYSAFSAGLAGFLALDNAIVAQLIATSDRKGALLGIVNLTNTLPAIVTPLLALFAIQVASATGTFASLLWAAVASTLLAAGLVTGMRTVR